MNGYAIQGEGRRRLSMDIVYIGIIAALYVVSWLFVKVVEHV